MEQGIFLTEQGILTPEQGIRLRTNYLTMRDALFGDVGQRSDRANPALLGAQTVGGTPHASIVIQTEVII
jgi:hypothetical protein